MLYPGNASLYNDKYKFLYLPIDSKFKVKTPKEKAKFNLALKKDKPHILIMGGSMGAGSVKDTTLRSEERRVGKEC